ncbi:glycerate kinase family protein [Rhizobium leguminosarum]|uniref:glycerate kinase family protein n=1 Tax=Rhizobium leguminosarum TaxID=384 RepID=UPI0010395768|nr:glycerate kinase [Rhizobium leguminosarum]MBY5385287.1 glycerate kinase [Rhizobium leguminosarum]MBY5788148.1 glycerate kinase [Rhizobium leguminosarum]MCA2435561.1 glycerate kinase [Rhizobium leguminosarum]NEH73677.1 glycerate kinase [Rhizobium leguminosarum]NEI94052.1 glycerate kinase [Rhizobium leguminosarum]
MSKKYRRLRVLVAPSGFKEGLGVREVADAIARGVRNAIPRAKVTRMPMIDGGEGFVQIMVDILGGELHPVTVTGPVGQPVDAHIGFLSGRRKRTAVIEMAAAAGLRLVPKDMRDPTRTTSYGVGEMIRAALDRGAERILLGCGDSGINDAGAGMAQALGVSLLDTSGQPIAGNGAALRSLDRIDVTGRDRRLENISIDVAVNPYNMLLGKAGVARVFGPQKGATPDQVAILEQGLQTFARIVRRDLDIDVGSLKGGGSSGGLGAGLHAFAFAKLHPRFDLILRHIKLDQRLSKTDLVMTAEGGIDGQTRYGKVPAEIARRAKRHKLPVLALAGTVGSGVETTRKAGIDAVFSILNQPCTLEDAIRETETLLTETAEQAVRLVLATRSVFRS